MTEFPLELRAPTTNGEEPERLFMEVRRVNRRGRAARVLVDRWTRETPGGPLAALRGEESYAKALRVVEKLKAKGWVRVDPWDRPLAPEATVP